MSLPADPLLIAEDTSLIRRRESRPRPTRPSSSAAAVSSSCAGSGATGRRWRRSSSSRCCSSRRSSARRSTRRSPAGTTAARTSPRSCSRRRPSHWFGTTQIGGDVFAQTMRGLQKSLLIGLLVAVISTGLAAVVGAVAGYFGGWVDRVLMWIVDLLLVIPSFLIIAIISGNLQGASWLILVRADRRLRWMITARIIRGMTLSLREREFVQAARYSGVSSAGIIFRHLIPNMSSLLIIDATIAVGDRDHRRVGPVLLRLRRQAAGRLARHAHRRRHPVGVHVPVAVPVRRRPAGAHHAGGERVRGRPARRPRPGVQALREASE